MPINSTSPRPAHLRRADHTNRTVAVCVDGRIVTPARARIEIDDWAFLYGWGVFETIRLLKRRPLFVDRHLARMRETARLLRFHNADKTHNWQRDIGKTIRAARINDGVINLYWTYGASPDFEDRRIVCVRKHRRLPRRGVTLWVAPWRIDPAMAGAGVKTMAYFANMFAIRCANDQGADTAFLLNNSGRVADAATSSIFLIEGDQLFTPSRQEGALLGVTRQLVLESARELGIPASACRIPLKRLAQADGVFLTSTLRGIVPVTRIDGTKRSLSPSAKRIIARLKRRYQRKVDEEIESRRVDF